MKTTSRILLLAGVLGVAVSVRAGEPVTVRVLADRVNLRSKPLLTAEVVAQVSSNDVLTVRALGEEWVEVTPPAHADLWVHRDLVKDSEVLTPNVNVRAGPGVNYGVVGKVSPGDALTRRGEMGDWVKIAPPASASLWVSAALVRLEQPPAPAAEPQAAAAAEPVAAAAPAEAKVSAPGTATATLPLPPEPVTIILPAPAATPEPAATAGAEPVVVTSLIVSAESAPAAGAPPASPVPEGFALLPVSSQGAVKTHEGELHQTGYVFRSPSRFRLVSPSGDTLCYVSGNQNQLRSLLGRRMRVTGREYWVKGKDQPILNVDRIVLVAKP